MERPGIIRKAAYIGILGNGLLAAFKIAAGILSGSYALVGDGIDSTADVASFIIAIVAAGMISRPATVKYPYGFQKAETIATKALSFIIFFAGFQFLLLSGQRLLNPGDFSVPGTLAIIAAALSIGGKWWLAFYLGRRGRKAKSDLLTANAKNMQGDVLISISVLSGLIFTQILNWPMLDLLIALLVGIWIIKVAINIFMETNVELMDGIDDPEVLVKIFHAVDEVDGAHNPHRLRTRKIADSYIIGIDIEVDPSLRIAEGHQIALDVERSIRNKLDKVFDVLVHVEPLGNIEEEEEGITRQGVRKAYPDLDEDNDKGGIQASGV